MRKWNWKGAAIAATTMALTFGPIAAPGFSRRATPHGISWKAIPAGVDRR